MHSVVSFYTTEYDRDVATFLLLLPQGVYKLLEATAHVVKKR